MMSPDDIIICNLDGDKICGARERTTEMACTDDLQYAARDSRRGACAPPVATGFAVAGRALIWRCCRKWWCRWDRCRWQTTACRERPR